MAKRNTFPRTTVEEEEEDEEEEAEEKEERPPERWCVVVVLGLQSGRRGGSGKNCGPAITVDELLLSAVTFESPTKGFVSRMRSTTRRVLMDRLSRV